MYERRQVISCPLPCNLHPKKLHKPLARRDSCTQWRGKTWGRNKEMGLRKGGGRAEDKQKEILGVSDVICSSCTRQELVICSTKAAHFIRQNRAGPLLYLLNRDIPGSKWLAEIGPKGRYHQEILHKNISFWEKKHVGIHITTVSVV